MRGLHYLHSIELAHGDLKGVRFLDLVSNIDAYVVLGKYPHLRRSSGLSRGCWTHEGRWRSGFCRHISDNFIQWCQHPTLVSARAAGSGKV